MKITQQIKKNRVKILYSVVLVFVFFVFIFLAFANYELKKINSKANIKPVPLSFTPEEFPALKNKLEPFISAKGAIIIDRDSQVVLYEKNPNLRFSPASTTKIMSALVALEHFKPDDVITVDDSYADGAVIKLSENEQFRFSDLIYAMMLPSANDAAKALATNYPGGEIAFVARMNEIAQELGLNSTSYGDAAGLYDTIDHTTPLELARLTSIAMQHPEFAKIVSTKKTTITNLSGKEYELENLNILLDLPGVNGVKTGFTQEAGQVLVTSKIIPDTQKQIIIVVMQSEDRFGDSQTLLNYLDGNITYQTIRQ